MHRSFCLSVASLLIASSAAAHGAPPAALAVLSWDDVGPLSVRLSEGLAQRADGGFRFVCPEAWGGDVFAPMSTLASGTVVVAGTDLTLVDAEGRVTLHPERLGTSLALARTADALFGLFLRDGKREVRRIEATHSALLYTSDVPFTMMAAYDDTISLSHFMQETVVVQHISVLGEPGPRVTWLAPSGVAYAELRATGDRLYAVVWGNRHPWVTLGRVTHDAYQHLREAQSAIAGPLELLGATAVATDGQLGWLEGGEGSLVQGEGAVSCLDSLQGRGYACVSEGLKAFDSEGVGAPLFQLATLREPDYQALPASVRGDCAFRWRDVGEHVAMLPTSPTVADAGAAPSSHPGASNDDEEASAPEPRRVDGPSSCAPLPSSRSGAGAAQLLVAVAILLWRRGMATT